MARPLGRPPTDAEIREAFDVSARLVADFGETYLPLFLRLEAEVAKLDSKADAVARARAATRRAGAGGSIINLRPEMSMRA